MKQEIIEALEKIAVKNQGVLLPADVVKAAEVKTSPLHSCFEWDNSKAAQAHRLWQARQLISVTVEFLPNQKEATPKFVSLKFDRPLGGGYRTMVDVLSDTDLRSSLLQDAKEDMKLFQKKYKKLTELAEVFSAMDKI